MKDSRIFKLVQSFVMRQDIQRIARHLRHITHLAQETGLTMYIDLWQAAGIGRDDRHTAGHSLEGRKSEALILRRKQEQVGNAEDLIHLLLLSEEADIIADTQRTA